MGDLEGCESNLCDTVVVDAFLGAHRLHAKSKPDIHSPQV